MLDFTPQGARAVRVPEGLFTLIGPPGSGKSTLVQTMVLNGLDPAAAISPDQMRALPQYGGDASDQASSPAVFAEANRRLDARLRAGQSALFDATGLHGPSRRRQIEQARLAHLPATALVARPRPLDELVARVNDPRRNRPVPPEVIARFIDRHAALTEAALRSEGFDRVVVFDDDTSISVLRDDGDWRRVPGPFVAIGDVHNCLDSLMTLLGALGFDEQLNHPEGLFPVLLGDVINKGGRQPGDPGVRADQFDAARALRWVLEMRRTGRIGWVLGNHEAELLRTLIGHRPGSAGACSTTVRALRSQPDSNALIGEFRAAAARLPIVIDVPRGERTVHLVHAGYRDGLRSLEDRPARRIALHASPTWVTRWCSPDVVVYGHTAQRSVTLTPNELGGVCVGIETAAYLGGGISAYRIDTGDVTTSPSTSHDVRSAPARTAVPALPAPVR